MSAPPAHRVTPYRLHYLSRRLLLQFLPFGTRLNTRPALVWSPIRKLAANGVREKATGPAVIQVDV
jgi:hypothetical protein